MVKVFGPTFVTRFDVTKCHWTRLQCLAKLFVSYVLYFCNGTIIKYNLFCDVLLSFLFTAPCSYVLYQTDICYKSLGSRERCWGQIQGREMLVCIISFTCMKVFSYIVQIQKHFSFITWIFFTICVSFFYTFYGFKLT